MNLRQPFYANTFRTALAFAFLFALILPQPVHAAPITVTNTNDSGAGSLRQAIADAASGDTINFNVSGTITLTTGALTIDKNLTIDGSGQNITLSGGNTSKIVSINNGNIGITISLVSLTLQDSSSGDGALYNDGTLDITNCTFSNNSTGSGLTAVLGGAIHNDGSLTINNSNFSNNSATAASANPSIAEGGAIYNQSTLIVTNSTFSNNSVTASGDTAYAFGGAISNHATGSITIINSTFSDNTATANVTAIYLGLAATGGAIHSDGTLAISNSTFFSNSVAGGGIYIGGGAITASTGTITNSTFYENNIEHPSTYAAATGESIWGTITLENTIIASGNTDPEDCSWNVTADSYSLDTDGTCSNATTSASINLGALADNGGLTQTMALQAGSTAINTGDNASCESTDQRGVLRPQGTTCDIGAYELDATFPTVASSSLVTSYTTGPSNFTVTFSEDVYDPSGDGDYDDVTNPENYLLVEAGDNGTFDTFACNAEVDGSLQPDDLQISVDSVSYNNSSFTSIVSINGGTTLPDGSYKLFVCGTTSIIDPAYNVLAGDGSNTETDYPFSFVVQAAVVPAPASLPKTGFRHGSVTSLPNQTAAKAYTETAMLLEIPKIGVSMLIVGVPQSESGWDVTWLGNSAGYLAGSAFPTWAGNTVITGHVWDAWNQPGAFAELKTLKYGDQVQIKAWGLTYTYEVRESNLVTTKNVSAVLQSSDYDWVTLVTCEFYNPFTGGYLFRRAVRAVLISVK